MNQLLVRRNTENMVNGRNESATFHPMIGSAKRKHTIEIDQIKYGVSRRALSDLNSATQSYVQLSEPAKCTGIEKMITNTSKDPVSFSVSYEYTGKENDAQKHGNADATVTNSRRDVETRQTTVSQQQKRQQELDLPELKSEFENVSLRRIKIVARAVTRAQQGHVDIHASNEPCQRSYAIPKDCHTINATTANVNALQSSENRATAAKDENL